MASVSARVHSYRSPAGTNLRHLIGMHDLNRTQVARMMEISPTGLANILTGRSEPSLRTALRAARAFGISIDDLHSDLLLCLAAALAAFESAPVRALRQSLGE